MLGKSIINWLISHGISLANMCGQCYDKAGNMPGAAHRLNKID